MKTSIVNYPVSIVGRDLNIDAAMRGHILSSLHQIDGHYPGIRNARVTCGREGRWYNVEIILFCAGHLDLEAKASRSSFDFAVDTAVEKLDRTIRKRAERKWRRRWRRPRFVGAVAAPDGMAVA